MRGLVVGLRVVEGVGVALPAPDRARLTAGVVAVGAVASAPSPRRGCVEGN